MKQIKEHSIGHILTHIAVFCYLKHFEKYGYRQ